MYHLVKKMLMNKIFQKLFGETASGIANIVDRFVQTKEEKHKANQEIQQYFNHLRLRCRRILLKDGNMILLLTVGYLKT